MTGKARVAALLATALLALAAPGRAQERVEVYWPRARSAESLAEAAQALLGPGGVAQADPGSGALVLRGEPRALEAALAGLAQLDTLPPSYQVHSTLTTLTDLEARGIAVEGWVAVGDVRVGRLPGPPERLRVRVRSVTAEGETRFEGMVATLDGEPAELWTGTTYPERVRTLHERAGELRVYETTTLVPVRTGFRVTPRGLGDGHIELEIEPVIEERVEGGLVLRAATASRVRVRPGESVLVASAHARDAHVAIDPFGWLDHREGSSDAALVIRVEPLAPPPAAP